MLVRGGLCTVSIVTQHKSFIACFKLTDQQINFFNFKIYAQKIYLNFDVEDFAQSVSVLFLHLCGKSYGKTNLNFHCNFCFISKLPYCIHC